MGKKDSLDIDRIAFLGRTYDEYMDIFDLDEYLLNNGVILDCPAGPSSFASTAFRRGFDVVACDAMYGLTSEELLKKGREDIKHVFDKFDSVSHLYKWDYYSNKEDVIALRARALELFVDDFSPGQKKGRYLWAELPLLPFPDNAFSFVFSGHFLFLYGDRLGVDFHKACLKEMARVCRGEVWIFPLAGHDAKPYPHLDEIRRFLDAEHIETEIAGTHFEFLKGANHIMKLRRKS